jgi:hypothetical protein
MKEVIKYQLMITVGGNARVKVFFSDNTNKIFVMPIQELASYDAILRQPDVFYDQANNYFISRDRIETRNMRPF